jgi:ADP-dependent NAD(P)H-hydrate dehydratase / NAD(P)H-hydrate epimerase
VLALYAPEEVRGMDARAYARGIAEDALMERAAGHLARGVLATAGRGYGLRVGILCGKGGNGGDGLAAARRLRDAGASVVVHVVDGADALTGLPAEMLRRWRAVGGRVAGTVDGALADADIAVDCLLGTGTTGEPRPPHRAAVEALNARSALGVPVVACDVPTGVDAATGAVPGAAVRADATVVLGAHKTGLWLWPARGLAGRLLLGEIGVVDAAATAQAAVLEAADVRSLLPPADPSSHKRTRGVVVILAGSPGMSGAAALVARGAMAAGAGLVTVATSSLVRHLIAPTIPEALTVDLPDDDPDAAFERLAAQLEGADALAVGPGLGLAEATQALVRRLVREVDVPLVLDADGINAFRDHRDALADHAAPLLVLTPHERELDRVGGEGAHADRLARAPELARRWDAVVVAKGPGSLVAAPDGGLWVNPTGSAALATGGTGDVLTGVTAALVAQRPEPAQVAAAVWLHGRAGEHAGRERHERSVTASDVAAAIPTALRSLDAHPTGRPRP